MEAIQHIKKFGLEHTINSLNLNSVVKNDLVILNYDQIKSPKYHPIADECRGLVVDTQGNLVARAFKRFYNLEEKMCGDFKWPDSFGAEKVDGSLILIYHYGGEWRINTRGSFGDGNINGSPYTWSGLVSSLIDVNKLNPRYTYVAELCSMYNQVVVKYPKPVLYLLSVFDGEDEFPVSDYIETAERTGFKLPEVYTFPSADSVVNYIKETAVDGSWEGFVIRDNVNNRVKVKNPLYVALHHLKGNGNIFLPSRIVPFIVNGEVDEVVSYFPDLKPEVERCQRIINDAKTKLDNFWFCHHDEVSQKKFAQEAIAYLGRLSSVAFTARKLNVHPHIVLDADTILNLLF